MRELIIGVVVDVLIHVRIEHLKGGRVRWIAASARDLTVIRDAFEFVVLDPEVCFEDFRCGREPKQCSVSQCEPSTFLLRPLLANERCATGQQPSANSCCACCHRSILQKRAAIGTLREYFAYFFHWIAPFFFSSSSSSSCVESRNKLGPKHPAAPAIVSLDVKFFWGINQQKDKSLSTYRPLGRWDLGRKVNSENIGPGGNPVSRPGKPPRTADERRSKYRPGSAFRHL